MKISRFSKPSGTQPKKNCLRQQNTNPSENAFASTTIILLDFDKSNIEKLIMVNNLFLHFL